MASPFPASFGLSHPESARSQITRSFCFRDGVKDSSAAEKVRRGSSVLPDATGLGGIVDLPQRVEGLCLGVFEEICLALQEEGRVGRSGKIFRDLETKKGMATIL